MKIITGIIGIAILILSNQADKNKASSENEHVSAKITLKNQIIASGDSGEIAIEFNPKEGYFINSVPILSIKLDSNDIIASTGKIKIPAGKKPEYVDTSQPVKLPIIYRKDIKKGKYPLIGTLTYFYCSQQDGWCAKYKQTFTLKVTVK